MVGREKPVLGERTELILTAYMERLPTPLNQVFQVVSQIMCYIFLEIALVPQIAGGCAVALI